MGLSPLIVGKINIEEDVTNSEVDSETVFKESRKVYFRVRHVVRSIFLQKTKVLTLGAIFSGIKDVRVEDVQHFNLFEGSQLPMYDDYSWKWIRYSLFRFMETISFIQCDRLSYYEDATTSQDIMRRRDSYLEWAAESWREEYTIYCQDDSCIFSICLVLKYGWILLKATLLI